MQRLDPRRFLLGGSVTALVVVASWGVRQAIERQLAFNESVSLIGGLVRLTRGENSGIAFGLLRDSPLVPWLSIAALVVLALVVAQQRSRLASVAWGLILGGGLANVIDRVGDERVTDYIDVAVGTWHYPTFNLPDIAITVGVGVLLMSLVRGDARGEMDAEVGNASATDARRRRRGTAPAPEMEHE